MSKTIHRTIGRWGERSADEASVAMIIKEVDDMDLLLGKLSEHTKTWRDSWTDILVNETRLVDSFHDVYQTIPRTGDSTIPPEDTPQELMQRIATLHTSHNDLKNDMLEEVAKIETLLVAPIADCRGVIKPLKKAIEKRENKKLDFERFNKAVESSKKKQNKSDRDYASQAKNEAELEKAKLAYEIADEYLRVNVPPILAKIMEFLPLITESAIQVQFTLVQHSYSALYHYANDNGFTDGDIEVIKSEWEDLFMPIKQQVETELKIIAKGKAVSLPMNHIYDNSRLAKLPSIPMGRGKKPPPPPPSTGAANGPSSPPRGREGSITSPKSGTSLHGRYSGAEDVSPAPPVTGTRPTFNRARASTTSTRDESPPPPLPGPRPGNDTTERPRMLSYGSSYNAGGVTPTPLAGLTPSQLRASNTNNAATANLASPVSGVAIRSVSDGGFAAAAAAKKKPPPPPPKKKFAGANETWVKALFTFSGQDSGDLSFNEGDRIKVTKKTPSTDDWWEGEVHGRKGSFPANYCEPA
ncbi:hypothetical protein BZA77DRAFT_352622 [Pyronema omphalodes]|nr:hypothetical protein BZA77DRAFT_363072 [Pyronema omphalodes]KAI5817673.1 hypothetical protein BZA77DRAFT_352622 [Pyronema omphalodes]